MAQTDSTVNFKLRRGIGICGGIGSFVAQLWRRRWAKPVAALLVLGIIGYAAFWLLFARDLPSVDGLRAYEPPLPTNVRAIDGTPVHSYARERRVELSFA